MLKESKFGGDVPNDKGLSHFPGNTNSLVVAFPCYHEIVKESGGLVPEFINPKYKDASRTTFKSAARLECMMQELPNFCKTSDKVGFTSFDRWLVFSPVKNDLATAATKIVGGLHPECALSGEADFFAANVQILQLAAELKKAKIQAERAKDVTFGGVTYPMGPKVVFSPSFGVGFQQIAERFEPEACLSISQRSCLLLSGAIKLSKNVEIDGSLKVEPGKGKSLLVEGTKVKNEGHEYIALDTNDTSAAADLRIRGFKVVMNEVKALGG
eukprot:GHVN01067711.1.p1 GENE.GHVN01067711.1~~GHVN01067711.1.p1  ORF type:complete len:270 (+),score=34.95 GHVN01067711.1:558-1367(+)